MVRQRRFFISFGFLAVVVLLNLPLPAAMRIKSESLDNIAPFQNFMSLILLRAQDAFVSFLQAGKALGQKDEMLAEIADLRRELDSVRLLEKENAELRKQLGFAEKVKNKLVMCRIVARNDASGWWQTVRLDKGLQEGIAPDMAVVTMDGLVGKTTTVAQHSAEVLLISDPNCKVSCKFNNDEETFGVVRGQGVNMAGKHKIQVLYAAEPCQMDYIDKTRTINKGAEVRTSGLGGVFPEGLLVGRVSSVVMHRSGLYQQADITTAARLSDLKYVFVVVK